MLDIVGYRYWHILLAGKGTEHALATWEGKSKLVGNASPYTQRYSQDSTREMPSDSRLFSKKAGWKYSKKMMEGNQKEHTAIRVEHKELVNDVVDIR